MLSPALKKSGIGGITHLPICLTHAPLTHRVPLVVHLSASDSCAPEWLRISTPRPSSASLLILCHASPHLTTCVARLRRERREARKAAP